MTLNNTPLIPLKGRFFPIFNKRPIDLVTRPYIKISKDFYDEIIKNTKNAYEEKATDFVLYENTVCTFGDADGGYALMPLQTKPAQTILNYAGVTIESYKEENVTLVETDEQEQLENLAFENKMFAKHLKKMGFSLDQISNIAYGKKEKLVGNNKGDDKSFFEDLQDYITIELKNKVPTREELGLLVEKHCAEMMMTNQNKIETFKRAMESKIAFKMEKGIKINT